MSFFLKGEYFNRGWSEATVAVKSQIWLCAAMCKVLHLSRVLLEDSLYLSSLSILLRSVIALAITPAAIIRCYAWFHRYP